MDPKLSQTDPRLQEAYDRVMNGTTTPPAPGGTVPPTPQPIATNPTVQQSAAPAIPTTPTQPASSPVAPTPSPMAGSTIAFNANNSGKNQGTTVKRGGSKVMTLVIGLGVIVLLVAYTFVWIYVFKLEVPFLPKLF